MFRCHDGGGGGGVETLKLQQLPAAIACYRTSLCSLRFRVSVGVIATAVVIMYTNFQFFLLPILMIYVVPSR
jgi:hypothetical protein